MGSFVKIRDKKTGIETDIAIQEYSVGLYVIENNDPTRQYGVNCSEKEFLEMLVNSPETEILEEIL